MQDRSKPAGKFLFALSLITLTTCVSAAEISSTFDTDLDGWTSSSGGTMTYSATGGNTGGFLKHVDADLQDMYVIAPAKFLGNQSAYSGGTLAFDGIDLDAIAGDYGPYGTVTLRSGGTAIVADIAPASTPSAAWATFSITLNAGNFSTDVATFNSLMSNLTAIEVMTESRIGVLESVGFDNFRLISVPEPSTLAVAAFFAPLIRRRRSQRA